MEQTRLWVIAILGISLAVMIYAYITNAASLEEREKITRECSSYISKTNAMLAKCKTCLMNEMYVQGIQPPNLTLMGCHNDS